MVLQKIPGNRDNLFVHHFNFIPGMDKESSSWSHELGQGIHVEIDQ